MPFPNETINGVTKNFEQVLDGLLYYVRPLVELVYLVPYKGWTPEDYLAALEAMVGDSSDRLWTAAIDAEGNSKADVLSTQVDALKLQVSRLSEQLAAVQVRSEK